MKTKNFLHNIFKSFTTATSSGNSSDSSSREPDLERIASREQKHFSYESLFKATDKFHPNRKLGEGGFGPVYKGKLEDGREIAVKRLSQTSRQGKKEFQNEARLLARVQHRNVVNLLGYCARGEDKLLVYEYIPNESLDKFLFKAEKREDLDWKKRYDVIVGVAKGLHYLHEDAHSCIIHRDIKASNILLDEKWLPKIADFGMARLFPENETHVNTRVAGTNGYMAPEYVMNGRLTVKADVFSFGVLMLELVSGRRNSSFSLSHDADNLLDWAYKMFRKGRSLEIMDPTLATRAVEEQVILCIHIGLLCTQSDPSLRPTMQRVLVMVSKKSSSLEDPSRPASFTGRQHRRSMLPGPPSSSNAGTSGASSTSRSQPSSSTSKTNTATVSANATTLRSPGPRLPDPRGKRPMESY